ncbi:MAG: hypothetical protein HFH84_19075 [Lachnospiraceae bacterium]|nr:hypothetical protein [Lachnospiraceae bacterium]
MKKFIIFITIVIFTFGLVSCGNTSGTGSDISIEAKKFDEINNPISLVIIVGRHANAGKPTDDMLKVAKGLILKSYTDPVQASDGYKDWYSTANVSIIVSDGFPTPVKIPAEWLAISAPYDTNVKDDIEIYAEKITQLLMSDDTKADNPEVDLIQALEQARILLNGKEGNKYILVLDTGITTTGHFDMRKINIMDGHPVDVVNRLPQEQLPDLEGITIMFEGIGNISNDPMNGQTKTFSTNQEAKKALKAVWIEVLVNRCKATLFGNDIGEATPGEDQPYAEGEGGYPYVSTVAFLAPLPPEPVVSPVPPNTENEEVPPPIEEIFNAATFFKGNSTDFVDSDGASAILYNTAEKLRDFLNDERVANEKIYVIGSIANTSENLQVTTNKYSDGRAKTVADELKRLLKDTGVDVNRIIPIDAGTTMFSWRNTDEFDSNGVWQDLLAQKNRVVAILSSNSEKAQESTLQSYIQ